MPAALPSRQAFPEQIFLKEQVQQSQDKADKSPKVYHCMQFFFHNSQQNMLYFQYIHLVDFILNHLCNVEFQEGRAEKRALQPHRL